MKLAGSVVVITGGSSGIGRALAVELGMRDAKVVVAARSAADLEDTAAILRGYGIDHLAVPFDVTSAPSIANLLAKTIAAYSRIDIVVNNAGIGLFENVMMSSRQDIDAVMETNFFGPLALMQAAAPLLDGGLLVNISSAAAKYAPHRQGIYAASKAALERITEAAGVEEGARLRTLLVVPDRTQTRFMDHVVGSRENVKLSLALNVTTAEAVARRIAEAIAKDKTLCYTTSKSRLYALMSACAPHLVRRVIERTSR